MKLHPLLLLPVLWLGVSAEDSTHKDAPVERIAIEPLDFPTSVRKQLSAPGVLEAFEAAESITVQLISSPEDKNATEEGKIAEGIIRSESNPATLTTEQRHLLSAVFSEDTTYREIRGPCFCFFTPQLRVTFDGAKSQKHYEMFLSGVSHGEIRVIEGGREIAQTRSWKFIPQYLVFMDRMFPNHTITRMLHEYHEQRLKYLANQAREATATAGMSAAGQPPRQP
jgi:hypothetical protein